MEHLTKMDDLEPKKKLGYPREWGYLQIHFMVDLCWFDCMSFSATNSGKTPGYRVIGSVPIHASKCDDEYNYVTMIFSTLVALVNPYRMGAQIRSWILALPNYRYIDISWYLYRQPSFPAIFDPGLRNHQFISLLIGWLPTSIAILSAILHLFGRYPQCLVRGSKL